MKLNYANIESGTMKQPMLHLRTLAGTELGPVHFANGLKLTINYASLSKIEFSVPYMVNGAVNPNYQSVGSYKMIYTDDFGVYVTMLPKKSGDGVQETKAVTGYSLEYLFSKKTLFLEEGTYNFWNPASPKDTILGRVVELDQNWSVGYVSPRLIGCYRTFDEYNDNALDFCYGDMMDVYQCAVVFDTYAMTINVYDVQEDVSTLPIYLNYQNLVNEVGVEELSEEMVTMLHVYGADDFSIRPVCPIGGDYLVDLSYFLNNGDLDIVPDGSTDQLSDKVRRWSADVTMGQEYYTGLVSLRSSLTAQRIVLESELTELQGELKTLEASQSVYIKQYSLETTEAGKETQQALLSDATNKVNAKKAEISAKETEITSKQTEIDEYVEQIQSITSTLSLDGYFTSNERKVLSNFLIEGVIEEETFVEGSDTSEASGTVTTVSGRIEIAYSDVSQVELQQFGRTMYTIIGGRVFIPDANISASIVRGTMDLKSDNNYTLTLSLGDTQLDDANYNSGMLTLNGIASSFTSDVVAETSQGITIYKGSEISFLTSQSNAYFTVQNNDFQKFSVELELYDFGKDALKDYAWPTYEFELDTANFLYLKEFEPFKNKLELGKAVHLMLGSDGQIDAKIIGVEIDFDNIEKFKLIFSNRYRLRNGFESIVDDIKTSVSSAHSFDASQYKYNRTADKMTQVDAYMQGNLDSAVQAIVGAYDESVWVDGAGIHISDRDSLHQMRLISGMLAMTDDGWQTTRTAIGRFTSPDFGEIYGVNAELIAGNLIVGKNLVLQNPLLDGDGNTTGYMSFEVDSTGAWLYNTRIVLQSQNGLIIVDPENGISAGSNLLYNTQGTTVTPEFLDNADINKDADGMPVGANFYLDVSTGDAYFRGTLFAQKGEIGGYTIDDDWLHAGSGSSYIALNGSLTNTYHPYAIWAGYADPTSALCPFWVKKDGTMSAIGATLDKAIIKNADIQTATIDNASMTNANVSGTLNSPSLIGTMSASGATLIGPEIYVPNKANWKFKVDSSGNVSIKDGSISWGAVTGTDDIDNRITNAQNTAAGAVSTANSAETIAKQVANGTYTGGTFINGSSIYSPSIYANEFTVYPRSSSSSGSFNIIAPGTSSTKGFVVYMQDSVPPYVQFYSPWGAVAYWSFSLTQFRGSVDFSQATVTGISTTATFG